MGHPSPAPESINSNIISRNWLFIWAKPKEGVSLFMGDHPELTITEQ